MNIFARLALAALIAAPAGLAHAGEADFLNSLDGSWSGTGSVQVRTDASPISVNCNFKSAAGSGSLSLDGSCRGLVIFSRRVSANLTTTGTRYAGSYVGAGTGAAGLSGTRSGNVINLGIRWAKNVNGDRKATLKVEKAGANGMRLTTIDVDPKSGKSVVTSRIDLVRA